MHFSVATVATFTLVTLTSAQQYQQIRPCNPTVNATGACAPVPGLPTSTYSLDFTRQIAVPDGWTISNYATISYGSNGAEFTFAKRYDAPQLWTDFTILFGRVEVVMQAAPGAGIISSAVLMSDDFDEIDWEFSGNNFNLSTTGLGQNNYFGKGVTGNYDRGQFFGVASPQTQFHTYGIDWTPQQLTWSVDGVVVRTLKASDCIDDAHQYPQTPSRLQLGLWDGGDLSTDPGTVAWAGGYTDVTKAPFTFYVKSVSITNANPAYAYNYTDQSGKWSSIQLLQPPSASVGNSATTVTNASSEPSTSPASTSSSLKSASLISASSSLKFMSPSASSPSFQPHAESASASSAVAFSATQSETSKAVSNGLLTTTTTTTKAPPPPLRVRPMRGHSAKWPKWISNHIRPNGHGGLMWVW